MLSIRRPVSCTRIYRLCLTLFPTSDNTIQSYCSITVNTITKHLVMQIFPYHYLMAVMKSSPIEDRCPSYTESKTIKPLLDLVTMPEACSIFTLDFIVLAVHSFTCKIYITLRRYQCDPFRNLYNPLFHFKLMSDFTQTNIRKVNSRLHS